MRDVSIKFQGSGDGRVHTFYIPGDIKSTEVLGEYSTLIRLGSGVVIVRGSKAEVDAKIEQFREAYRASEE